MPTKDLIGKYLSPESGGDEPVPKSALMGAYGQWNCTEDECDYFVALGMAGVCVCVCVCAFVSFLLSRMQCVALCECVRKWELECARACVCEIVYVCV